MQLQPKKPVDTGNKTLYSFYMKKSSWKKLILRAEKKRGGIYHVNKLLPNPV
jgi:hypothetical protein